MQKPATVLVKSLQAYCSAKPGIIPSITFGEAHPSYHILGQFLLHFAHFFLDETPIRLLLRCKISMLEGRQNDPAMQISKTMRWEGNDWKWVEVLLDGTLSEAELIKLLDDSYEICIQQLNEHDMQLVHIAEQPLTMRQAIHTLIYLNKLKNKHQEIESLIQSAILLRTSPIDEAQLHLGQSKLGGSPDLPPDWTYPHFNGKPLAFLAQINLAEIPISLPKTSLPATGILYFFSVFGWQDKLGGSHVELPWQLSKEPNFSQVLYFNGTPSVLKRQLAPSGIKTFKSASVNFTHILSLPRAYEYARDPVLMNLDWTAEEFERFDNVYSDFNFIMTRKLGFTPNHKLLGYCDPIQAPITQSNTRLLCQIASDNYTEMMWADGGIIYFTISQSDLENQNFTTVYSDMQFG